MPWDLAEIAAESFTCQGKNHKDNSAHNKVFLDYLQSTRFEQAFMKTKKCIKFFDNLQKFVEFIPDVVQQYYECFVCSPLFTCTKTFLDTIKKNSFVTPTTKEKRHSYNQHKYSQNKSFNKLRTANIDRHQKQWL